MTRQVLFNGAVLVRAGGATRVDASAFQNLGLGGLGTVGLIGEAEGGVPGQVYVFSSPQQMVGTFRSGPLADAADLVFRPMNDTRVPGGAQSCIAIKVNQSVGSTLNLSGGGQIQINAKSLDAGAHTNRLQTQISTVGGGKVVQNTFQDGPSTIVETSPPLGAAPDFLVEYVGTGTAATMTVNGTTLTTTCTGATGDNLNLQLSAYGTLADVLGAIAQHPAYTVSGQSGNPYVLPPTAMDWQSATDIKTAPAPITSQLQRVINWANTNSTLVRFTRANSSTGVPPDDTTASVSSGTVPTALNYAGGSRGTSTNSTWQTALDTLGAVRVNQLVPLIPQDLSAQGNGSTATFASVASATDTHAAYYSSTEGKNEVQAYLGMAGTKTQLLAQAGQLQSPNTVLVGQKVTRPNAAGNIVQMEEWALACIMAGGRAGSDMGEPLVYKTIRCNAITQHASWNPNKDGPDMILAGSLSRFPARTRATASTAASRPTPSRTTTPSSKRAS